jgi:CheY-like chemotaxis protein
MKESDKARSKGIIVLIDDDEAEQELLQMALNDLGVKNQLKFFPDAQLAYDYLKETKDRVFLILCDLNMPKIDGIELKRMIEGTPELKIKAIPFFFHSNSATETEVKAAYALGIQGYIQKSVTMQETQNNLEKIIALWTAVVHPKDFG